MPNLRQLLATWENWSAHDTLTRALANVTTKDSRERINRSLAETPAVSALDALRDGAELIELLTGWQWQAIYAARQEGASWAQIGAAIHTSGDGARAALADVLDHQEQVPAGSAAHCGRGRVPPAGARRAGERRVGHERAAVHRATAGDAGQPDAGAPDALHLPAGRVGPGSRGAVRRCRPRHRGRPRPSCPDRFRLAGGSGTTSQATSRRTATGRCWPSHGSCGSASRRSPTACGSPAAPSP